MGYDNLRFKPAERFFILFVSLAVFALIGSVAVGIVVRNGMSTSTLRVATVIQDCLMFILPAIVCAILISPLPARFLGIDRSGSWLQIILALAAMMTAIPAINWLVQVNEGMVLPESLHEVEEWMKAHEESARESVKILLGGDSIGSLIIDLLIVGVFAGFSEELLFRGALLRIILSSNVNRHIAVWTAAFVFSAMHLQFYGFFPRLLLGAYFGYLFVWSESVWLPALVHSFNNSLVVYATWRASSGVVHEGETSLNEWGADSVIMIMLSVTITACFIVRLARTAGSDDRVPVETA